MRSVLFWVVTQPILIISYRHSVQPLVPHLQESRNSRPLKMEPIGCSETSVRNFHYKLCNNAEERRARNLYLFHPPVAYCISIPLHLLWFSCLRINIFYDRTCTNIQPPWYVIVLIPSVNVLFLGSVFSVLCNQPPKIKGQIYKEVQYKRIFKNVCNFAAQSRPTVFENVKRRTRATFIRCLYRVTYIEKNVLDVKSF